MNLITGNCIKKTTYHRSFYTNVTVKYILYAVCRPLKNRIQVCSISDPFPDHSDLFCSSASFLHQRGGAAWVRFQNVHWVSFMSGGCHCVLKGHIHGHVPSPCCWAGRGVSASSSLLLAIPHFTYMLGHPHWFIPLNHSQINASI